MKRRAIREQHLYEIEEAETNNSFTIRKKDNTISVCARIPVRLYLYCSYIFIKSRILTEGLQRVVHIHWIVSLGGPEGQLL